MPRQTALQLVLVAILFPPACTPAQVTSSTASQPPPTANRDPRALAVISRSIQATGISGSQSLQDFQVTAKTSTWNTNKLSLDITISGRIGGPYRFELTGSNPDRHYVSTTNNGAGQHQQAAEGVQRVPPQLALSDAIYFPLPYLVEAASRQDVSLTYKGSSTLNGLLVDEVEVGQVFPSVSGHTSHLDHFTERTLAFDSTNGLLLQISYQLYSEKNAASSLKRTISYAGYSKLQSVQCPRHIVEYQGSAVVNTIDIQTLTLNPHLPESNFHLSK